MVPLVVLQKRWWRLMKVYVLQITSSREQEWSKRVCFRDRHRRRGDKCGRQYSKRP